MDHERMFRQIECIYQTMNIYKAVLVYTRERDFLPLKEMMIHNDYSLTSEWEGGRVYDVNINRIKDFSIDWNTISIIICIDDESYNLIKRKRLNHHNLNLIIKI